MFSGIPVNIVTGALGAGKTTAIARLLASKPLNERWVVILNEFTDSGIDALTVAAAAVGAYDVRAIPGGCLCCTGEEDFQQQLGKLVQERPARILIEPSGIAHPGTVIDELRAYERTGRLRLMSTIALVDISRLHVLESPQRNTEREQVEAADVLLLSKAEQATPAERDRFFSAASALFPPKRWIGLSSAGVLPSEALQPPQAKPAFGLMVSETQSAHAHSHRQVTTTSRDFVSGPFVIRAQTQHLLNRCACSWVIPAEAIFAREQLAELQRSRLFEDVERMKAVLRTGIEQRLLAQCHPDGFSTSEIVWRQESRIEVQLKPGRDADWSAWDRLWLTSLE